MYIKFDGVMILVTAHKISIIFLYRITKKRYNESIIYNRILVIPLLYGLLNMV
jgi:hypothetical protein